MASDLQNIYRMLQALDEGQTHIIGRLDTVERQQTESREDRAEIKRMLLRLDDPDIGRVARAEAQIRTLMGTVKVFDSLRQRGLGIVIGAAVVLLFVAEGASAAIKKIVLWLFP